MGGAMRQAMAVRGVAWSPLTTLAAPVAVAVQGAAGGGGGGRRHMGMFDRFKDKFDQQKEDKMGAKRNELFRAQLAYLASRWELAAAGSRCFLGPWLMPSRHVVCVAVTNTR